MATYRVELDASEIEPGVFVYAEVEMAVSFDEEILIEGYPEDEYPVPTLIETPLASGSMVDSSIWIAVGPNDGDPEEEIHWETHPRLFSLAEGLIINWLAGTPEGRAMTLDAIEEHCCARAEDAYERAMEAR